MAAFVRPGRFAQVAAASAGLLGLAVVAFSFSLAASPAQAQTCTVTDLADSGDGTLRDHLADTACDIIDFGPTGTITLESQLSINRNVEIQGPGPDQLSVSGDDEVRVFEIEAGNTVTISGLTITGGNADDGGGIWNDGTLTVQDCTISGNHGDGSGGGVWNGDTLTVENSTISGNHADGAGGGIMADRGEVTVTDSTISGNSASFGGALLIFSFDTPTVVTNSTISANSSSGSGGGIWLISGSGLADASLTLQNSIVSGNISSGSSGGILNEAGSVTVQSSTISGNLAGTNGGGIRSDSQGLLTVTDSTVSGNFAGTDGGGIRNLGAATVENSTVSGNSAGRHGGGIMNTGIAAVENSTVSGNSTGTDGGGIRNSGAGSLLTATNSTVSGNAAGNDGGGIWNSVDAIVKNSIVAESRVGDNCALPGGTFTSEGDNLDDDGTCTGFEEVPDVMLDPLADNGGPTLTHALLPDSPAIDAVSDCTLVDGETPVETDQRGAPRPHGKACDIGAFEFGAEPPTPTPVPGERLWGDLDCDENVDIGDALKTARHLLGLSVSQEEGCPEIASDVTADGEPRAWGDVDCDETVAIGDALKIARWLLGLSVSQEEGCPEIGSEVTVGPA